MAYSIAFSLHGQHGQRKYLNAKERAQFYACTKSLNRERRIFSQLLYYTGARFSEIHALCPAQFNYIDRVVTIRTLKRRRTDIFREIPLPDHMLSDIQAMIDLKYKSEEITDDTDKIWSFSKRTGARLIKNVMQDAQIDGVKASALGLRHGFAVFAVTRVPLTQVQKWMGHAYLATTALYLNVSGIEERKWAEKLWEEE